MPLKYKLIVIATLSTLMTGVVAMEKNQKNSDNTPSSLDETRITQDDQKTVAVTIYNQDLALVKDTRKVNLKKGLNALALRDVSAQIRPETALLRSINAPDVYKRQHLHKHWPRRFLPN